jgi:hypothetical protein
MLPLLLILSVSCNKGDQALIKPILQVEPFSMKGFAVEPIDQYFDGVKVQELYGTINETKEMAFIQEETVMELRNKTTGEVLYTQKFNSKDAENKVPRFYFDGSKVKPTYEYPAPQGAEYTANFFFDFPKEMGAADVVMVFVEYYEDPAVQGGYAIAGVTNIPIATNIQTGKWSEYIKLPTTPDFPPQTRPDTYFELFVCVRKTGSDLYFTNTQRITPLLQYDNAQINAFSLELPYQGVSQGKVQSYYIGLTEFETGPMLTMKQDLVQLFR